MSCRPIACLCVVLLLVSVAAAAPFWSLWGSKEKKGAPSLKKKKESPPPHEEDIKTPPAGVPVRNSNGYLYGETVLIGNTKDPSGLVTMIHSVADDGHGWHLNPWYEAFPQLLFAMPSAPVRPLTFLAGEPTSAWMDVYGIGRDVGRDPKEGLKEDIDGLKESAQYVHDLSNSLCLAYNIPQTNVVYGGFSQGADVALYAALTSPIRPKGVILFSGTVYGLDSLKREIKNRDIPIFMSHGSADHIISVAASKASWALLTATLGYDKGTITYNVYEGISHLMASEMVEDARAWMQNLGW